MEENFLAEEIARITEKMRASKIGDFIDRTGLDTPIPFKGSKEIKLVILGQDPTVRDAKRRREIKSTLLLKQRGTLRTYISRICRLLDLKLDENIYATNLLKNFFTEPPFDIEIREAGFIKKAFDYWKDLLTTELEEYRGLPVITLGEPVVNCLVNEPIRICRYWGYDEEKKSHMEMRYIRPEENILNMTIFPFPHVFKREVNGFYLKRIETYTKFMRETINKKEMK